ncbi:hypothetical protein BDV95DRAFT_629037 [Massariosphaeria phaeospora]|uniref:Uncharacterized protein n=1 Tax=Massariosphaeria phaeospora TaxID=100035 RepID=A0A7C8I5B8_9PLEO|nr:hypothetical protein BDV95DRAFT_629037 [Massariosphaeria phaeospora]
MKAATHITSTQPEGDWSKLQRVATSHFKQFIESSGKTLNLTELVQFVTLKGSLCYLFEYADTAMSIADRSEDINFIGRRINTMATFQGPRGPAAGMGAYPSEVDPENSRTNPINLLLPAYETMWCVVLHCLLEVKYHSADNGPAWERILTQYLQALNGSRDAQKEAFSTADQSGVAAVDIVKEALRLYPPSKRVHRLYYNEPQVADIEKCHHSALLGQNDPLVFRPERWLQILPALRAQAREGSKNDAKMLKSGEEQLGFMPFALVCTADIAEMKGFGMKMVALLVAVLCAGLGDEWEVEDLGGLPAKGVVLAVDRMAYGDLMLKRK